MKIYNPIKLGILGSRGIPNRYGGFEEFAERLSVRLSEKGFDVWVYNSHRHPCRDTVWQGVNRIMCNDPEHVIGQAGQFIYDLNCINDSRRRKFDIILQLGYTSSSIWHGRLPASSKVITNMDGLEWKRSKYSSPVQRFLKYAEKLAVRYSDLLIADNIAIRQYLLDEYAAESVFIPYGADMPRNNLNNPEADKTISLKVGNDRLISLQAGKFFLVIARLQPDNHIEEIIRGFLQAKTSLALVIVGEHNCRFGRYLKKKYTSENIIFAGGIFEKNKLDELRRHSKLYFHGHSAGGTNPSLLEAMAASALICAHDNPFNRKVLDQEALYFTESQELADIIKNFKDNSRLHTDYVEKNLEKIKTHYTWENVCNRYETLFINTLGSHDKEAS